MATVPEMTNSSYLLVFRTLGEVTRTLDSLAASLRKRPEVIGVDRVCDPRTSVTGASVEWFVDSELVSGAALSWHLVVYWSDGEWIIESEVRRMRDEGSEPEVELATRFALDEDLAEELASAARTLIMTVSKIKFVADDTG